jgi:hypothetical protein
MVGEDISDMKRRKKETDLFRILIWLLQKFSLIIADLYGLIFVCKIVIST